MSLVAVKDDEQQPEEKKEPKKQSLTERFDNLLMDVYANGEDIIKRKMNGSEIVTKEEIEAQGDAMKLLKDLGAAISLAKKLGRLPDEAPSGEFSDMAKVIENVKKKKSSVGEIIQKINRDGVV